MTDFQQAVILSLMPSDYFEVDGVQYKRYFAINHVGYMRVDEMNPPYTRWQKFKLCLYDIYNCIKL